MGLVEVQEGEYSPRQLLVPRRIVVTLPDRVGRALLESANANQRPSRREVLRLLVDQLKAERLLPDEYVP